MLIQFSVKNYKTFKERTTLSLVASSYDKETREDDNVISDSKSGLRLLKSAAIYGANASGKSKFVGAMQFMKQFVTTSSKETQNGDKIPVTPFMLDSNSEKEPIEFETIFIFNDVRYRYGFEVTNQIVVSEWLYQKPKTKEVALFFRSFQDFDINIRKFSKGNTVYKEGLIRDNALMISVAAQFNDIVSTNILNWFKEVRFLSGLKEERYLGYTISKLEQPKYKRQILSLLNAADLSIQDVHPEIVNVEDLPQEMKDMIDDKSMLGKANFFSDTITTHKKYDQNKKRIGEVTFSMDDDESSGTRKFFGLTGPILDTLEKGYTLFVDELDSKLHPNLVYKIVSLFNSKTHNSKNAQLIFNTHDTNLLSSGIFRKDQVWFTEKDKYGVASLYSLADFKSSDVRKNEAYEDNYLRGKYGAVPFLAFFDDLIHHKP